jgi:hypothetical protein
MASTGTGQVGKILDPEGDRFSDSLGYELDQYKLGSVIRNGVTKGTRLCWAPSLC